MRTYTWKKLELAILLGLSVTLLWGAVSLHRQETLSRKMIRLHVIANSDSDADQALKLRVRDAVLEQATAILERSADRREAESRLRGQLLELERTAEKEIQTAGYSYPVTVKLENTDFPTKEYGGFTLPAGEYLALRVIIGEGQGKNWWCVVFPPLCTAVSADVPASALAAGFDQEEVSLITEENQGYVLKFKAVEWWETLKKKWD